MKNILLDYYEKYGLFIMALFIVVATLPTNIRLYVGVFGVMALLLNLYTKYAEFQQEDML